MDLKGKIQCDYKKYLDNAIKFINDRTKYINNRETKHSNLIIEYPITKFNVLLDIINNTLDKNLLYRGQNNIKYQLIPSLLRGLNLENINPIIVSTHISNMIQWQYSNYRYAVKQKTNIFLDEISDLGKWAYGQHYRLPTHLLDWTKDINIALFFMIEESVEDSALYIFNDTLLEIYKNLIFLSKTTLIILSDEAFYKRHKDAIIENDFFEFILNGLSPKMDILNQYPEIEKIYRDIQLWSPSFKDISDSSHNPRAVQQKGVISHINYVISYETYFEWVEKSLIHFNIPLFPVIYKICIPRTLHEEIKSHLGKKYIDELRSELYTDLDRNYLSIIDQLELNRKKIIKHINDNPEQPSLPKDIVDYLPKSKPGFDPNRLVLMR